MNLFDDRNHPHQLTATWKINSVRLLNPKLGINHNRRLMESRSHIVKEEEHRNVSTQCIGIQNLSGTVKGMEESQVSQVIYI